MADILKDTTSDLNIKVKDFTGSSKKSSGTGKRKREDPVEKEEQIKRRRDEYNELIHNLLADRILTLERMRKAEEAKKKKKEIKEPSEKQKAQWSKFREKVSEARKLYKERGVKGVDQWAQCMKEVAKAKSEDKVLSDAEISQLVDLVAPPNQGELD